MSAKVYKFPEPNKIKGYKIPLYSDEEIMVTVISLNTFCFNIKQKVTSDTITNYDPTVVIDALTKAKDSSIFSNKFKLTALKILNSVERIEVRL
jgi:hypothetical protein